MKTTPTYRCFQIPRSVGSQRAGAGWIWSAIPAHLVCVSVPWIHPRLRRRVHRRGPR